MKKGRYAELENYLNIINKVVERHLNEAVAELEGKDIILTLDELKELINNTTLCMPCKALHLKLEQLVNELDNIVIEGNDTD